MSRPKFYEELSLNKFAFCSVIFRIMLFVRGQAEKETIIASEYGSPYLKNQGAF